MKNIVKILIIMIVLGCCCQPINGLFLTDLGIIEYNDYLQVDIEYPGEIQLEYVYSSINNSAIIYDKLTYIPETNTTRYLFTSNIYFPEYYERLGFEEFLFQDINSKHLYVISIDMSNNTIPDDPYEVELIALTESYNNMSNEYADVLENLTSTWNELNSLLDKYNDTWNNLNITMDRNLFIEALFQNNSDLLNSTISELNIKNETLLNMTTKANNFKRFFDEKNSFKAGFNYANAGETKYYQTDYSYKKTIEKKNKELSNTPFIIIFVILFTALITALVCYWKFAKNDTSPEEMEIRNGTDPTTTKVNRFKSSLKILPLSILKKSKQPKPIISADINTMEKTIKTTDNTEKNNEEKTTIPVLKTNIEHDKILDMVDERINNFESKMEEKIDLNHRDLVTIITQKLEDIPTTMKSEKR